MKLPPEQCHKALLQPHSATAYCSLLSQIYVIVITIPFLSSDDDCYFLGILWSVQHAHPCLGSAPSIAKSVRERIKDNEEEKSHEHLEKKGGKIPQRLQPGAGEVSVKAYQPHWVLLGLGHEGSPGSLSNPVPSWSGFRVPGTGTIDRAVNGHWQSYPYPLAQLWYKWVSTLLVRTRIHWGGVCLFLSKHKCTKKQSGC